MNRKLNGGWSVLFGCALLAVGCQGEPLPADSPQAVERLTPQPLTGSQCVQANAPGAWMTQAIAAQGGSFSFDFDVAPTAAPTDAVVGLLNGVATQYGDLSTILRFNRYQGAIDAYTGDASPTYLRDQQLTYAPGTVYHVHMPVDLPNQRYSVFVTPPGQPRVMIASGYHFRKAATALDGYAGENDPQEGNPAGGLEACNPVIGPAEPVPGCYTATKGGGFVVIPLPTQTGTFVVEMNVVAGGMDRVVGLVKGTPTGYSSLAAIARFNTEGWVDVRNGGVYARDGGFPYNGTHWHHITMAVNVPAHTYSVWMGDSGTKWAKIATDYHFRTEQSGVTSLDGLALYVDPVDGTGTNPFKVCGAAIP